MLNGMANCAGTPHSEILALLQNTAIPVVDTVGTNIQPSSILRPAPVLHQHLELSGGGRSRARARHIRAWSTSQSCMGIWEPTACTTRVVVSLFVTRLCSECGAWSGVKSFAHFITQNTGRCWILQPDSCREEAQVSFRSSFSGSRYADEGNLLFQHLHLSHGQRNSGDKNLSPSHSISKASIAGHGVGYQKWMYANCIQI